MFSYSLGLQVVNRNDLTIVEGSFNFRLKRSGKLIKSPVIRGPQEVFDFGLICRYQDNHNFYMALTILFGMMISPYLRIGYAYDQSLFTDYYRNQTHEIMIEYRIPARAASSVTRCGSKEFWYH